MRNLIVKRLNPDKTRYGMPVDNRSQKELVKLMRKSSITVGKRWITFYHNDGSSTSNPITTPEWKFKIFSFINKRIGRKSANWFFNKYINPIK